MRQPAWQHDTAALAAFHPASLRIWGDRQYRPAFAGGRSKKHKRMLMRIDQREKTKSDKVEKLQSKRTKSAGQRGRVAGGKAGQAPAWEHGGFSV